MSQPRTQLSRTEVSLDVSHSSLVVPHGGEEAAAKVKAKPRFSEYIATPFEVRRHFPFQTEADEVNDRSSPSSKLLFVKSSLANYGVRKRTWMSSSPVRRLPDCPCARMLTYFARQTFPTSFVYVASSP